MKILLLGDASNYHRTLGNALAREGHAVTVASAGSGWMKTSADIDLSRHRSKLGGLLLYTRLKHLLASDFRGYDVVQLCSTCFVNLRPRRQLEIFRALRRHNGAVCVSALGTDEPFVRNLSGPAPALAYSEWHTDPQYGARGAMDSERALWLTPELHDYADEIYGSIDGAVSALYEYQTVYGAEYPALKIAYGGIPVDPADCPAQRLRSFEGPLRVMIAAHRGREAEKGIDRLRPMFERYSLEYPGHIELWQPENVPYTQFTALLDSADIVVDQLYSYTPATTALMAMAGGAVAVTGGEDDYYRFIGEDSLRPIFNPDPRHDDATYRRLVSLLSDREALRRMAAEGPQFVRRHNDASLVARRFLSFWTSL